MIAWEPQAGGPWHLTESRKGTLLSLCGIRVVRIGQYVQRDPHKIDHYGGERCPKCWMEWKLRAGASLAQQDQHFGNLEQIEVTECACAEPTYDRCSDCPTQQQEDVTKQICEGLFGQPNPSSKEGS